MIVYIYGRRNSGKSAYAEERTCLLGDKRIYLATMVVMDKDGEARVEKHRQMRADKGFITIECPVDVNKADIGDGEGVVLLECISNLVGNELFRSDRERKPDGHLDVEGTVDYVLNEVEALSHKVKNLVIVSSLYDDENLTMDEDTASYIRALSEVNDRLKDIADESICVER